jgi:alpha-beta hydrolase superfamily lysophospholipase
MPAAMLARAGFNVLLIDLRDQGETTCEDGRHSAGQDESDDVVTAAYWLKSAKAIPLSQVGVHGVSGGALAALIVAAKNHEIAAFSLEAPVFDFNKAATHEVQYQGFPGFFWRAAYWAARVRGKDLMAVTPTDGIERMGNRPVQVLHGTADSRVGYHNATDLAAFAEARGLKVTLHSFEGADHIEGLLLESQRYQTALVDFFSAALPD